MRAFAVSMLVGVAAVILIANLGYAGSVFGFVALIPGRDTTGHFVIFGVLSFAVNSWRASATGGSAWRAHFGTTAVLALLVTAEELSQLAIPTRSFSTGDLFASLAGLLIGALASLRVHLRRIERCAA